MVTIYNNIFQIFTFTTIRLLQASHQYTVLMWSIQHLETIMTTTQILFATMIEHLSHHDLG